MNFCFNGYRKVNIHIFLLFIFLSVVIFTCQGCSTGGSSSGSSFDTNRDYVLSHYFTTGEIQEINADAATVSQTYAPLVNVFSAAQYGTRFIEGTVDIKDVFDTRNSQNYKIFVNYAVVHNYVLDPPPTQEYTKYALAATHFLRDYEYDVVLFRPDEFHPVLTKTSDTWFFLREDPDGNPPVVLPNGTTIYYSGRIKNRHVAIQGGMSMKPINDDILWPFYVPAPGAKYENYASVNTEIVENTTDPSKINKYTPKDASDEILLERYSLGIISSPLSGKHSVRVGGWKPESYYKDIWNIGYSFTGNEKICTWGGGGHYIISLDPAFWVENSGASFSDN
jgi:hypothetical protein